MNLFGFLGLDSGAVIDWEMTPEYTFGTFESWGGKERVRSNRERIYYFYVDAWEDRPKLMLMERGVRHARIVAEIRAPRDLLDACVASQGKSALYDRSYAIDDRLRQWLERHVVDADGDALRSLLVPVRDDEDAGALPPLRLPSLEEISYQGETLALPRGPEVLDEAAIEALIVSCGFYEAELNPRGGAAPILADPGDGLTVVDLKTRLRWQRQGLDIMSHRMLRRTLERLNQEAWAGFGDWRLPSLAEALSLMVPEVNEQGLHLPACLSPQQPFIFVDAVREPGGYWFVDYKQGRVFWSSGTIPGGFGRLCRSE